MHCRGHQKGHDEISKGNRRADQAAKSAAKPLLPPDQASKVLLCKQDDPTPMPNHEFYMNWRKFDYTSEIQQRLRRAYKLMLNFFGVKLVGKDGEDTEVTEVERAENFAKRFDNLTIKPHNNLKITRILLSLGELGAEEYQAPLVKFLLKETLIEHNLPRMKKSVMNFFVPAVRDVQKRQDLLYFAWRHYQPKEEFIWGKQEELEKYKATPTAVATIAGQEVAIGRTRRIWRRWMVPAGQQTNSPTCNIGT
uniref:RNase H type-1 domain-containing protein n=1 Tax=Leptobrachium leishanense TaxID=445787 RepID=A0A8C5QK02_9ANUR